MAQVEIGFGAVFRDEDLTMLERAHRPGIHIQVGIQLENRNVVAPRLQQPAEARRHDSLANAGHHTTGDEDEFGHDLPGDSSN